MSSDNGSEWGEGNPTDGARLLAALLREETHIDLDESEIGTAGDFQRAAAALDRVLAQGTAAPDALAEPHRLMANNSNGIRCSCGATFDDADVATAHAKSAPESPAVREAAASLHSFIENAGSWHESAIVEHGSAWHMTATENKRLDALADAMSVALARDGEGHSG